MSPLRSYMPGRPSLRRPISPLDAFVLVAVLVLLYLVLRSVLLMTLEAPEARYTLECFPMLFVLGGVAIASAVKRFVAKRSA